MTSAPESPCREFDRRAILYQEPGTPQGKPDDMHIASCRQCQLLEAKTARLQSALASLPIPTSTSNWQQAVFARIAAAQAAPARRRWWLALPLTGAAAVLLLVLTVLHPQPRGPVLALAFEEGSDRVRSKGQPAVGATLVVRATPARVAHVELRIYRDDGALLLRCTDAPPCRWADGQLQTRFTIPAIGRYRVLVAAGDQPIGAPIGSYDQDLAGLVAAGADRATGTLLEETFEVW